jgi:hypothetical protein
MGAQGKVAALNVGRANQFGNWLAIDGGFENGSQYEIGTLPDRQGISDQQRLKAGLFEVSVGSERFGQTFIAHYNERDAVRERPFFVSSGSV